MIPDNIGEKLRAAREYVSMRYEETYKESKVTPEEIKSTFRSITCRRHNGYTQ